MLVLSRKKLEAVVAGDGVGSRSLLKVTVLEIQGQMVRLGFEADADVIIHRWEVWERIRAATAPAGPAALAVTPVP
jgi:carbon storage regulator CsrA